MKIFGKKKKNRTKHNLKGRVQCNESCQIIAPGLDETIPGLIREFNWLGLIIDHIPFELKEIFKLKKGEKFHIKFKMPREFGSMEFHCDTVQVSQYQDIVDGKDHLRLDVNLEDQPEIEVVREFVSYRNRRFSRHQSSRRSLKLLKSEFLLKWFIFFPTLLFVICIGLFLLYKKVLSQ